MDLLVQEQSEKASKGHLEIGIKWTEPWSSDHKADGNGMPDLPRSPDHGTIDETLWADKYDTHLASTYIPLLSLPQFYPIYMNFP